MSRSSRLGSTVLAALTAAACGSEGPARPDPTLRVPVLLAPSPGATLDNGCRSGADGVVWDFDWTDVPDATAYQLRVFQPTAASPAIDVSLPVSAYRESQPGRFYSDVALEGWRVRVRALVEGEWGEWSAERSFDLEPESTDCAPPVTLLAPAPGAVVDNGCRGHEDERVWEFDWSDVAGAKRYHLYVRGPGATYPAIDDDRVPRSSYVRGDRAYVVEQNRRGWRWRVRAYLGGSWSEWTPERAFDVEPLDADCP